MVRTYPHDTEAGLNPARIGGIATAILVHAGALMLLLIPATLPPLAQRLPDRRPQLEIIKKPVEVPVTAPPPADPKPPIAAPRTPTTATPVVSPPAPEPVEITQADPMPWTPPATIAPATPTSAAPAPSTGPISASHLSYVSAPAPRYPRASIARRSEGTVMLRVLVDVDGKPLEVVIETSSGDRELDRAARQQVLDNWRFQPAMQDGHPVQAYGRVPVDFRLR